MTQPKDEPSKELEEKAAEQPGNEDVQVDLGNDESMDASDANSAVQPGGGEDKGPYPSNG